MKVNSRHVLLIEDDLFLRELYLQALQQAGFIVQVAQDAQEGLDLLDEYGADLLVLDLMLPAHGGIEALHELQSHSDWQSIPVVVLSSVPRQRFVSADLKQLGVKHYLYKPETTPAQLVGVLSQL